MFEIILLGLTSRWGHGCVLLEALRWKSVSSSSSASRGHCIPRLTAPASIPLLPPSYKDPCDYSGPIQIIPGSPLHFQVLNPFCKVPFAKSVTFTGSRDGDKDICRGHYSASHRGRQTPPPALPWCPCPLPTLSFFNWNWSSGLHDLSSSYVWDRAESCNLIS